MATGGLSKAKGRQQTKNAANSKNQAARTETTKTKKIVRHFKSNPTCEVTKAYLTAKGYNCNTIQRTGRGLKREQRSAS